MANTIDVLGDEQTAALLISKTITEFVDDVITKIGDYAFYKCLNLTNINLPNVTNIGPSSFRNSAITNANFPNAESILDNAFTGCSSLASVNLPNATTIGTNVFDNCSSLTSASLPNVTNVQKSTFVDCANLVNVDVSSATTLTQYAFRRCASLVRIDLPAVTNIGNEVFQNCTALTTVILRANQVATLSNANAFTGANNAIIYVPDALVDSYKAANNWSTYASRIKGISELPAA